jgi:hypothetical protein
MKNICQDVHKTEKALFQKNLNRTFAPLFMMHPSLLLDMSFFYELSFHSLLLPPPPKKKIFAIISVSREKFPVRIALATERKLGRSSVFLAT